MDPLGFALENFDAVGAWRDKDRYARTAIDASGKLVDGTMVSGPADLRKALMKRPAAVRPDHDRKADDVCARAGAWTYYDMPMVRKIVRDAARDNYRFSSIVMGIAKSAPFQMRKNAGGDPKPVRSRQASRLRPERFEPCSLLRNISTAARSCAAWAPPSACRCWMP